MADSRLASARARGMSQPSAWQRVDADARAVGGRVVIDELVPPELVVDAPERRLQQAGRAVARKHRNEHARRPVPRLPGIEIGEVVVERDRRGEDSFFALGIERVEIVDEPVADRAVVLHAAGDQREMTGVRLVVVTLRAVDHDADDGATAQVARLLPSRCHSVSAVYGLRAPPCGSARTRSRSASAAVGALGQRAQRRKLARDGNSSGHNVARDHGAVAIVPRTFVGRIEKKCADDASKYERLSAILGVNRNARSPSAVASSVPSSASRAPATTSGAAIQTRGG